MKRQGLNISIAELEKLIKEISEDGLCKKKTKFLVSIINKTPECSDTWEIEK